MKARNTGFTLIELTLALAFVGILLVAVVTVAVSLGNTYQRGITMRDVNQVGRQVMEQMRRDIANADPAELEITPPIAGTVRLCTGSVSYIVNLATEFNDDSAELIEYDDRPVRLMRVSDGSGMNCAQDADGKYPTTVVGDNPQDLLVSQSEAGGSNNLAIHQLTLTPVVGEVQNRLYDLGLRIGTNDEGSVDGDKCQIGTPEADLRFCVVYDFETIVRVGYGSIE